MLVQVLHCTVAGCAVVKTGGTPPCRPPACIYTQAHTTHILVQVLQQVGSAVVNTGGTPPCGPPYILLRQGGHPPVDPPPGHTRRHTRHTYSYRYGTVLPACRRELPDGDDEHNNKGGKTSYNRLPGYDYEYEKCILIPKDYFRPAHV